MKEFSVKNLFAKILHDNHRLLLTVQRRFLIQFTDISPFRTPHALKNLKV